MRSELGQMMVAFLVLEEKVLSKGVRRSDLKKIKKHYSACYDENRF